MSSEDSNTTPEEPVLWSPSAEDMMSGLENHASMVALVVGWRTQWLEAGFQPASAEAMAVSFFVRVFGPPSVSSL